MPSAVALLIATMLSSLFLTAAISSSTAQTATLKTLLELRLANTLLELERLERENAELRSSVARGAEDPARAKKVHDSYAAYQVRFYENDGLTGNVSAVLRWQGVASNVMMGLTVIVALCGLLFSGYQLWIGSHTAAAALSKAAESKIAAGGPPQAGDPQEGDVLGLTVKASEFQFRTTAIGLAVLFISCLYLHFFYINVYKIDFGICQRSDPAASKPLDDKGKS